MRLYLQPNQASCSDNGNQTCIFHRTQHALFFICFVPSSDSSVTGHVSCGCSHSKGQSPQNVSGMGPPCGTLHPGIFSRRHAQWATPSPATPWVKRRRPIACSQNSETQPVKHFLLMLPLHRMRPSLELYHWDANPSTSPPGRHPHDATFGMPGVEHHLRYVTHGTPSQCTASGLCSCSSLRQGQRHETLPQNTILGLTHWNATHRAPPSGHHLLRNATNGMSPTERHPNNAAPGLLL